MKTKMICGIFIFIMIFSASISIFWSPDIHSFDSLIIVLILGSFIPFYILSILLFKSGYKEWKERQNILKNGIKLTAKIIDYEDGRCNSDNNQRYLDLIITFDLYGKKKIARLATDTYNESKYPINSNIEIAYLSGKMLII